jgi:hypothetical protein
MEQRWNDTDSAKPKDSEINLYQCHFVHHKSHTDLGANPGLRSEKPANNSLRYSTDNFLI